MLDPLSAIIGISQAVGTLGAVGVALWLGLRQGRSDAEALNDSHRPILVPAKDSFTAVYKVTVMSDGKYESEYEESKETGEFSFNLPRYRLLVSNAGPGVALNVDGILTEPKPAVPSPTLARSYRLNLGVPIASGEKVEMRASEGGTMLHGTAEVVPSYELYAPQEPSAGDRLRGVGAINLRLTLTCSDIFGKVHGFVYDFTEDHKWVCRIAQRVERSIEDHDQKATKNLIP